MKNYLSSIFIKKTHFFLTFFLFVIFIASFVLEKFFNFQPCILCSVERWTCFILSVSLFSTYFLQENKKKFSIRINLVTSFAGFTTSIYHKFVQNGLASCSFMQQHSQQTFENFQENLQNTIPCGVKSSLFGVELVWFNIVIFGIIFLILLLAILFFQKKLDI